MHIPWAFVLSSSEQVDDSPCLLLTVAEGEVVGARVTRGQRPGLLEVLVPVPVSHCPW